ncbi:hypothetical protein niasHT_025080 [Heterodera trifolii]|uniref:BACK domain-containing protein n=1 Tax=Heterodera trifolii TaxID=157864 RepID=A0ABD2K134_9BILA
MEKLIKSDDFLPIDQKLLLEILSREQLKVGEESAIWQAALRWADQQCHQNGIECSGDNRRQMLGQILMTIRFPLMAKEDFVKSVVPSQVLTDKEVISVLLFHSHSVATECGAFDQFPLQFSNQQRILTTARDSPSPKGRLLLKIQKFSHIILRIYGSRPFCSSLVKIMGFSWYLSSNLFGIQNGNDQLCFFLNCNSAFGVPEWSCSCSTTLRIVSQKDDKMDHFQTDRLFFQKNPKFMHDSGLLCKMPLRDLMSSENGWHDKEKDTLTVTVDVTVENAEIQPSIQKQK